MYRSLAVQLPATFHADNEHSPDVLHATGDLHRSAKSAHHIQLLLTAVAATAHQPTSQPRTDRSFNHIRQMVPICIPHYNNGFLGPRECDSPNDISIGSAVFALLIIVTNTHTHRHTHSQTDRQTYDATYRKLLAIAHIYALRACDVAYKHKTRDCLITLDRNSDTLTFKIVKFRKQALGNCD